MDKRPSKHGADLCSIMIGSMVLVHSVASRGIAPGSYVVWRPKPSSDPTNDVIIPSCAEIQGKGCPRR